MNELRMNLTVRDITINKDFQIVLPVDDLSVYEDFRPDHEYIIIEHDNIIVPGEFCSIQEINEILQVAAKRFSMQDLMIMSKTYLYEEVKQIIENGECAIIDFDSETCGWNFGNGGNHTEEDYGRCLYEQGYNFLPELVPEGLMDYIEWEANWNSAETSNWRAVLIDNNAYLVNAGI